MKSIPISKALGASLLAASLVVAPLALPSVAQNAPEVTTDADAADSDSDSGPVLDTTPFQEQEGKIDNFGWLGLLGALGLLNLFRKSKANVEYREIEGQPLPRDREIN